MSPLAGPEDAQAEHLFVRRVLQPTSGHRVSCCPGETTSWSLVLPVQRSRVATCMRKRKPPARHAHLRAACSALRQGQQEGEEPPPVDELTATTMCLHYECIKRNKRLLLIYMWVGRHPGHGM